MLWFARPRRPMSAVDGIFKVYGIECLRIEDESIMQEWQPCYLTIGGHATEICVRNISCRDRRRLVA